MNDAVAMPVMSCAPRPVVSQQARSPALASQWVISSRIRRVIRTVTRSMAVANDGEAMTAMRFQV